MPDPDKYGTQSAIALLRQYLDYHFWYDRQKLTLKEILNVHVLGAMNHKAGSFTVWVYYQLVVLVFLAKDYSKEGKSNMPS